jgi:hypothetical protein
MESENFNVKLNCRIFLIVLLSFNCTDEEEEPEAEM